MESRATGDRKVRAKDGADFVDAQFDMARVGSITLDSGVGVHV